MNRNITRKPFSSFGHSSFRFDSSFVIRHSSFLATLLSLALPARAGRIESPINDQSLQTPLYSVEGHALSRHNGPNFNNRPLYCNQLPAVLLAGDKPLPILGSNKNILGNLLIALQHNHTTTWAHEAKDITARYLPGRYEYIISDPAWQNTTLHLELTTTAEGPGLVAHLHIDNPQPNDTILLASGAAYSTRGTILNDWDMTIPSNREKLHRGFVPSDCANNQITLNPKTNSWALQSKTDAPTATATLSATNTRLTIIDATTIGTATVRERESTPPRTGPLPAHAATDTQPQEGTQKGTRSVSAGETNAPNTGALPAHAANDPHPSVPQIENAGGRKSKIENPLLVASFPATENPDTYFSLQEFATANRSPSVTDGSSPSPTTGTPPAHAATDTQTVTPPIENRKSKIEISPDPKRAFELGMQRAQQIEQSIQVDTPDPWLNAAVADSTAATDGVFRNGIYTHAGMKWGVPLLGWRTIFGGTVYGAHDRVKTEARSAINKQITESDKTSAHADPKTFLSSQAPDSRLFGKGRIDFHQPYHYDMQSQFFEQIQHAWRATGDPELESLLAKSLPLHCEYLQQCFDPENSGIYESYCNTWPTDDQWYNGGGTSEETAYAYRAESTALQLARRAHDEAAAKFHQANIDRIKKAFFDLLWNNDTGHPGAYREQGGLKRLHDSCWLYAIFCPVDAGLLTQEQAASSLYYTETQLQRVNLPYGGQQCWPSNWVPSLWSVREMWPGDNYQLALAYFQTGLPNDGYKLLRGTFPQQALFGTVPGDLGHPAGGTDFNDCLSMFDRTIVEGLFGYIPDYTNNQITFRPNFPTKWDHASIKTPDFSLNFTQQNDTSKYEISITHAALLHLELPVCTSEVKQVLVNGAPAKFEMQPAFGRTLIILNEPRLERRGLPPLNEQGVSSVTIEIQCADTLPSMPSDNAHGKTGNAMILIDNADKIIDFHDPQHIITDAKLADSTIIGKFTANTGDHILFALTQVGKTQQWRQYQYHITDEQAEKTAAAKNNFTPSPTAKFERIPLDKFFNADIRDIYKQKYLSPRPNTVSLRLAEDGYGTWQMVLQKNYKPPEIELFSPQNAPKSVQNAPVSVQSAPFLVNPSPRDIVFTSLWENFPKRIEVPINKSADAISFLVAGTTNPMEVRIPNAKITITYDDNSSENIDLIPPFNFWTLCPMDGVDYDYRRDGFALPKTPPPTIQLGKNCRANVITYRLKPNATVKSVALETLSNQVVVGLMGVTLIHDQTP